MCGIAGIWNDAGASAAVQRMVGAIRHRGPDDAGVFHDERVAIGMARLAIIDVSPAGHQPMTTGNEVWIVYNGETYNFAALRSELEHQGVAFRSHSDTEVLLRLYERYGDAFLPRLRGMFALAIYDRRGGRGKERLLLARDHLGIKPLYYSRQGSRLVFASELKGLIAGGIAAEIDSESLRELLVFGSVPQPRAILRGVRMLAPGSRMIVTPEGSDEAPFWSLAVGRMPELARADRQERIAAVSAALKESVRLQMVSDVGLGAFLSGGIDSALTVGFMAELLDRPVSTFSVGYGDEGQDIDETGDAEIVARHLGTRHARVQVGAGDILRHLSHFAWSLDQPSIDGANSYFISQAARTGVTVAISGTGGDELFAGYPWFAAMRAFERELQGSPIKSAGFGLTASIVDRVAGQFPAQMGRERIDRLRRRISFLGRYGGLHRTFSAKHALAMLAAPRRAAAERTDLLAILRGQDALPAAPALARVTGLCLRGYTLNQLLRDIDAVSMAHSLEVRVPLLDPILCDLALSLPDEDKLRPEAAAPAGSYAATGVKRILLDVAERSSLLPAGLGRRPKRGFGMPFDAWLRGPLNEVLADTLSTDGVRKRGLFDERSVAKVHSDFMARRAGWSQVWLLMVTELWCRQVIDRPNGNGMR